MAANPARHPMRVYPPQPSSAQQAPSPADFSTLPAKGYPELASFFSQCSRYLHVRSFSGLAVRLLLYRQHELVDLELKLASLENEDAQDSDPNKRLFSRNFAQLKAQGDDTGSLTQRSVYETLKSEMKEYGI
jgi:hypothetical protein